MRQVLAVVLLVLGLGGFLLGQGYALAQTGSGHVSVLTLDGTIEPINADFLSRGIETAEESGAELLVVRLDTPGGLLDSTREMVERILEAQVPVVVYVAPPGAQAASAGTFITASAHIAAMAPSTNIGAASPVGSGGEELPETLRNKATQDAAAFIRSIAEERGRNADALEQTVLEATSFSASEALDQDIIDLIAEDMDALMAELDGRTVVAGGQEVVLSTQDAEVRSLSKTPVERFLSFLANPNVAFLLLSIGGLGIMVELFNPGLIFPGLTGAVALALAFVALGNLPVNWVGLGLLALAMGLFFLEMEAPGIGLFGIAGAVCFVLGGFLLFGGLSSPPIPTPSFRVSLWLIGVVSAIMFALVGLLIRESAKARKAPEYHVGGENPVGKIGVAATTLNPRGSVQLGGERWSAVSDNGETIPQGEEVIVLDMEGLTLKVFEAKKELYSGPKGE